MNYYILRAAQQHGPYSLTDLQNYLAQGSIVYTDLARTDGMSEWVPLSQLLQTSRPAQPLPPAEYAEPPLAGAANQPVAHVGPVPPALHWVVVLVLGMVTGLFTMIWVFVQSSFIKKIDPASKATMLYVLSLVVMFGGTFLGFGYLVVSAPQFLQGDVDSQGAIATGLVVYCIMMLFMLGGSILFLQAAFKIRDSMVRYYNTIEPIQLRMSAVMTFFFHVLYIQYHMSRIAKWKETGFLIPQQ